MPRRVIDLSQPLSRESQLHPFFPPTQILRHIQHTDAALGDPSFSVTDTTLVVLERFRLVTSLP